MKKLLKLLPFFLVAVMAVSLWSCSDDDDDLKVTEQQLPATATQFLSDFYPSVKVTKATLDDGYYDVTLANRHTVDFTLAGEWTDVDAPKGQTIPSGFYPTAIDTYISEKYNGVGINEISRKIYGYDVELVNNSELRFSTDGSFLGYDF